MWRQQVGVQITIYNEISQLANVMTTEQTDWFGAVSGAVDESRCGADTDRETLRCATSVQGECARQPWCEVLHLR